MGMPGGGSKSHRERFEFSNELYRAIIFLSGDIVSGDEVKMKPL